MAKKKLSKVTLGEIWYWIRFIVVAIVVAILGLCIILIKPAIITLFLWIVLKVPLINTLFITTIAYVIAEQFWRECNLDKLWSKLDWWCK